MEVKRLERSLECSICWGEPWDTANACGHLFGAECIKQWLAEFSAWREVDDGVWVLQTPLQVTKLLTTHRSIVHSLEAMIF